MVLKFRHFLFLTVLALGSACSRSPKSDETNVVNPADILMEVGDSVLTRADVLAHIPAGISPEDSTRLFDAIVEEWLERNMLVAVAEKNLPDPARIDRLVEQYRRQLLTEEYRRLMKTEHADKASQTAIRKEYDSHPERYILEQPLVKGIYVKLSSGAHQLSEVREWVAKATPEAIDELESYGLHGAMEYDYFGDKWVAWEEIAKRIPYRFETAVTSQNGGGRFETEVNGITYLLHVTDAIAPGEKMPFEFASPRIEQELMEQEREAYDRRLLRSIYKNEVRARRVKPGSYTPLRYRDMK